VIHHVNELLAQGKGLVELESGDIVVPPDATHRVIFRRLQLGAPEIVFSSVLVAMVAVGGIDRVDPAPEAKYCFFRLFFDYEGSLITRDVLASL
jgi:hypothetical protein